MIHQPHPIYLNCFADSTAPQGRTLPLVFFSDDSHIMLARCLEFCTARGFPLAGVARGRECHCGAHVPPHAHRLDQPHAQTPSHTLASTLPHCASPCGGAAAISVYRDDVGARVRHLRADDLRSMRGARTACSHRPLSIMANTRYARAKLTRSSVRPSDAEAVVWAAEC